jgi:hypothetical protein
MYTLVKYDKEEILGRILYLACITNSDMAVRNFFLSIYSLKVQ